MKDMITGFAMAIGVALLFTVHYTTEHAREMLLLVAVICAASVMSGCNLIPPPTPVPTHIAGGLEHCKPACDNLARMQCPGHEGSPGMDGMFGTIDDVSCAQACRDIVGSDPSATLYQLCVIQVSSCADADRCLAEGP